MSSMRGEDRQSESEVSVHGGGGVSAQSAV
jgi:hypothetical protein